MRKFLIALILLAILAAAGYGFYLWRQQQQAAQSAAGYQTQTAGRGSLVSTIGATGQVRSQQSANLAWKTSGTVKDVLVQVGDKVQPAIAWPSWSRPPFRKPSSWPGRPGLRHRSLEDLYTNADTAAVQALQTIAESAQAVKDAQYQLDNFTIPKTSPACPPPKRSRKMEQRLNEARLAFEPYKYLPSSDPTREDRLEDLNQAQSDYNTAVKRLEYEYTLQVAQANLEKAARTTSAGWTAPAPTTSPPSKRASPPPRPPWPRPGSKPPSPAPSPASSPASATRSPQHPRLPPGRPDHPAGGRRRLRSGHQPDLRRPGRHAHFRRHPRQRVPRPNHRR